MANEANTIIVSSVSKYSLNISGTWGALVKIVRAYGWSRTIHL